MGSLRSLHKHRFLDMLHVEFSAVDEHFTKFYSYLYDPADLERTGIRFLGGRRSASRISDAINTVSGLMENKKLTFSFVTLGFSVPIDVLYLLRDRGIETYLWTPNVPLPNFLNR
jgi:hypothetical protein